MLDPVHKHTHQCFPAAEDLSLLSLTELMMGTGERNPLNSSSLVEPARGIPLVSPHPHLWPKPSEKNTDAHSAKPSLQCVEDFRRGHSHRAPTFTLVLFTSAVSTAGITGIQNISEIIILQQLTGSDHVGAWNSRIPNNIDFSKSKKVFSKYLRVIPPIISVGSKDPGNEQISSSRCGQIFLFFSNSK